MLIRRITYASNTIARLVGTEDRRADDRRDRHRRRDSIFRLTGGQRVLLAALHAEDAIPERRRAASRARRCASPASRSAASRRSTFAGEQVDVIFEVNKDVQRADHRPVGREARVGVAARRERRRHHAVDQRHADSGVGLRPARARRRRQLSDITEQAIAGIDGDHRRWSATSAAGEARSAS